MLSLLLGLGYLVELPLALSFANEMANLLMALLKSIIALSMVNNYKCYYVLRRSFQS